MGVPLCAITLWKSPAEAGDSMWVITAVEPALSPKMVTLEEFKLCWRALGACANEEYYMRLTLSGSPPKVLMFFCTHFNASVCS